MRLSQFGRCLGFALGALSSVPARGELPANSLAESAAQPRALVVLVGAAGRDAELSALLRELLASRGVEPRISIQERFQTRELLQSESSHDTSPPSDHAPRDEVHVFIVPGEAGSVRLFFRAPDGERFLLRSVVLRSGFDDLGRELLGQIVDTAVASLLHSADGLTREQARAALGHDAEPDADSHPAAKQPPVGATTPQQAGARAQPRGPVAGTAAIDGWFALRYGASMLGGELDPTHGPGLELGVSLEPRRSLFRVRVLGERDFRQTLETPLVAAELQTLQLRLQADAGLALTRGQHLLLSLGAGQERTSVKPLQRSGSNVAPASGFQNLAPVAHVELRYEVGGNWLRLATALGADVALVDTHYDVSRPSGRTAVATPWRWRPTAAIAVAFCPRWATF